MGSQDEDQIFIVAFFDNWAAASVATRAAVQGDPAGFDPLNIGLLALDAAGRIVVSTTGDDDAQPDRRLHVAVGTLARAAANPDPVDPGPTDRAPLDLTTEDVARIVAELEAGQAQLLWLGMAPLEGTSSFDSPDSGGESRSTDSLTAPEVTPKIDQMAPRGPCRHTNRSQPDVGPAGRLFMTPSEPSLASDADLMHLRRSQLTPQIARPGMIQRHPLVARITSGEHLALVSISAPTGYGKTTMLGQVVDTTDRAIAWLTLDERCNDPAIFLTYLAAALDPVLHLDNHVTSWLEAPHANERSRILELLATAVRSAALPFLLVLDDVHLLHDHEGLTAVWTLFESLPDKSLMLIAGQRSPNLPMARQRVSRELLEIGPSDLAFDFTEARQLFDEAGVSASDDILTRLIERTGGWAAALHFATRAAARDAVPPVDLLSFGGGDRLLSSYVKSEILDQLPESSRTFLVRTSVLDELTGPLCDYVLQRSGSAQVLVDLDEHSRLTIPQDRERHAYQYSPVLREALRRELGFDDTGEAAIIHRRASEWYAMQGDVDGAVKHAQAVDDVDRVASLLVSFAIREYAVGRAATLRSWFAWLEDHRHFPREAAIVGAWLHLLAGRADAAQQWAEYAEMASLDTQMPDGSTCEGWLFTLRAAMAFDVDLMRESSIRAIETLSHHSPWRPTALSLLGCAELWRGEHEASEMHLMKAAEIGTSLGANASTATALAARAELEIRRENWSRAQTLVNGSLATVEKHHLTSYITSSLTFAIASCCALRKGDRAAASKYLELAQSVLPDTGLGLGLLGTQSRLALIRVHLALGEAGTAAAALKEVERFARVGANLGTLTTDAEALASQLASLNNEVPASLNVTAAEMRLLPLLATAYPLREIAEQLHLSVHTVKTQAASIYRKLGVASRPHAVERAFALGLVSAEPQLGAHYLSERPALARSSPRPPRAR